MTRKVIIWIIIIAFFVGGIGSIILGRFVFPYLGNNVKILSFLNQLVSNAPIVVNRTEQVQLNEGVNLIDLLKQAGNTTVSIYNTNTSTRQFLGSGLIATSDGLILTSNSILADQTAVRVILNDGRIFDGLVRAKDPKSNLIAVTIAAQNLPVAQFDKASDLQTGQRIFYLGRSNTELSHEFATGFVTKTVQNSTASLENIHYSGQLDESFATDAVSNPNLWGGPVVDLSGHVVGLVLDNSKILISENLQSALSIYLSSGKITRPSLGLKYFVLSKELSALKGLPGAGVLVVSADKASPAESAKLLANDLITAVDGQSLDGRSFEQILNSHAVSEMTLSVWRAGKPIEIVVKLISK